MAAILRGKRLEDAMSALRAATVRGDVNEITLLVRKGLHSGSGLLARQAVLVATDFGIGGLREPLETALEHLLAHPATDPGCVAKEAIAQRLLNEEGVSDTLWQTAARHVQLEPSFGQLIDTAGALRGISAMGVAASSLPNKIHLLIDLLLDPETAACAGAIRALGVVGTDEALSLIRFRALVPQTEPSVVAECLRALLHPENIAPASITLAASFLRQNREEISEEAALALGESRDLRALSILSDALDVTVHAALRGVLLRAIALLRREEAFRFLMEWLDDATPRTRQEARDALEPFRNETALADLFR